MRRFRLKFFDPDVMDWRYLRSFGRRGSTSESWCAGQYTTTELEHHANLENRTTQYHCIASSILAAIDSGHLTKEYV